MSRFTKIIKRDDGTRFKIDVTLYIEMFREPIKHTYTVIVSKCLPGKRKYKQVSLNECTDKEILEAKTEYWQSLKPL